MYRCMNNVNDILRRKCFIFILFIYCNKENTLNIMEPRVLESKSSCDQKCEWTKVVCSKVIAEYKEQNLKLERWCIFYGRRKDTVVNDFKQFKIMEIKSVSAPKDLLEKELKNSANAAIVPAPIESQLVTSSRDIQNLMLNVE